MHFQSEQIDILLQVMKEETSKKKTKKKQLRRR